MQFYQRQVCIIVPDFQDLNLSNILTKDIAHIVKAVVVSDRYGGSGSRHADINPANGCVQDCSITSDVLVHVKEAAPPCGLPKGRVCKADLFAKVSRVPDFDDLRLDFCDTLEAD